ncbi:MAG: hypothetical protein HY685_03765 [Chloroflexi bacterium]|nr:hypothetical protein [Chloroflexota bacterium]
MRAKLFAVFVIFTLLVSLLPAAPAGAATTALDYVKPASTFTKTTGFANADATGTNVLKFRVTDDDLNLNKVLAIAATSPLFIVSRPFEIAETANGDGSFDVANSPIGDATGDGVVNTNDVLVRNLQATTNFTPNTIAASTVTTVSTIAFNAVAKLDEDAAQSADNGYIIGATVADQVVQATFPTQLRVTATIAGSGTWDVWFNVTRVHPKTGATSDITAKVTGLTATATNQYLSVDYTSGTGTTASPHPATLVSGPLASTSANALFISAFKSVSVPSAPTALTGAIVIDETADGATIDLLVQETDTIGVNYVASTENDTDSGTTTFTQTVKVTSTSNATGISATLFETDTTTEAVDKISGKYQRAVMNWAQWKSYKTLAPQTAKGIALIDTTLLGQILARNVVGPTIDAFRFNAGDSVTTQNVTGVLTTATTQTFTLGASGDILQDASTSVNGTLTIADFAFTGDNAGLVTSVGSVDAVARTVPVTFTSDPSVGTGTNKLTIGYTFTHSLARVVSALNTETSAGAADQVTKGADWITNSVPSTALNLSTSSNTWKELSTIIMGVADGDTVTVTYSDVNGAALTKTVTIDLAAPTITGASPANAASVNTTTPLLTALVKDVGTGFSTTNLTSSIVVKLTPSGGSESTLTYGATGDQTAGFTITAVPGTALAVTTGHVWKVEATDLVGNKTVTGSLTFAVDNVAPTVSSALTGTGVRLKGSVTSGTTTREVWEEFKDSSWIKVTMTEGISTPAASALDIAGSSPAADVAVKRYLALLSETCDLTDATFDEACETADRRNLVYLKAAAALAANAVPKVTIVGVVADLAGNSAPTGTATGASATPTDSIAPTLTVGTLSRTLGKSADTVVIPVTSNEGLLGAAPAISVGTTCPGTPLSVVSTGTNAWSATYTISTQAAFLACANGSDIAGNAATQKTSAFQADVTAPTVASWAFANQASLETEDVLFLNFTFSDAAEYTGDTRLKVTVSSATLEEFTAFGGTLVKAVSLPAAQSSDTISHIYGVQNLPLGFYKLSVKGTDEAGNVMSAFATREFKVVARAPISVNLSPGWNLVSLPSRPSDPAIDVVMKNPDTGAVLTTVERVYAFDNDTKVWKFSAYNATTSMWEGTLTQITDGVAYFVRSTSFDPIKYLSAPFDPQAAQPSYRLTRGWNAIGFSSLTKGATGASVAGYLSTLGAKWTTVRSYDPANGYQTAYPSGEFTANFTATTTTTAAEDTNGNTFCGNPAVAGDTRTDAVKNADLVEDSNGNNRCDPAKVVSVASVLAGRGYFVYVTDDVVLAP